MAMSIATQQAVVVPQDIWELLLRELQQNKENIAYLMGIVKAKDDRGMGLKETAQYLGMSYQGVLNAIKRYEKGGVKGLKAERVNLRGDYRIMQSEADLYMRTRANRGSRGEDRGAKLKNQKSTLKNQNSTLEHDGAGL